MGGRSSLGGEVAVGDGSHGHGDITGVVAHAEGNVHYLGEGVGGIAHGNLYRVVDSVRNGIPNEGVGSLVVSQAGHGLQNALVYEHVGDGGGIALGHGGDGEADTAGLHGAVAEVIVGGLAVVIAGVVVTCVAALNGEQVLLGVLNGVEDQGAVNDSKAGYAIQSLVAEVTGGSIRVILGLVGNGVDLNHVVTGLELGEVHVLGGGAQGLLKENGTVGRGDLQLVAGGTHNGVPLDRGSADGNLGSGKLGALGRPNGVQGNVGGQDGLLGELGGELLTVAVHTGEPAAEDVTLAGGSLQAVELTADGRGIGESRGTLVAQIKVDGVLGGTGNHLSPAGVEHGVGLDEGSGEVEGGLQTLVGVPAQENEAVLLGVGRLGGGFAVDYVSITNHTAAVGIVADGEADLLEEGHNGIAKGQNQGVAVQGGGGGPFLLLDEIEGDLGSVDGVLTRRVVAGARERELIAAAECQLQFSHLQVVVVDTRFSTLRGGS